MENTRKPDTPIFSLSNTRTVGEGFRSTGTIHNSIFIKWDLLFRDGIFEQSLAGWVGLDQAFIYVIYLYYWMKKVPRPKVQGTLRMNKVT